MLVSYAELIMVSSLRKLPRRGFIDTIRKLSYALSWGPHLRYVERRVLAWELLLVCRYFLTWEWLYHILQYVYFLVYLIEDLFPFGPFGYHLMLVATRNNDE